MSKLTAYLIGNQPLGVEIYSWLESDLNGNVPFKVEDNISPGYGDISSIENWDRFGELATNDYYKIRDEIKSFYDSTTFTLLSSVEKEIVSRWFISSKSERETIKDIDEQESDARILSEFISKKVNDERVNGLLEFDGGLSLEVTSIYKEKGTVFGSDYLYVSSESESSTSSSSWQRKLRMTTPELSGVYRILWFSEITNSDKKSSFGFRVQLNGSNICEIEAEPQADKYEVQSGFYVTSLTGVQNIDIDFNDGKKGDSKIRRCRIEIIRIS